MNRLLATTLIFIVACSGSSDRQVAVISTLNTVGVGEQRLLVEFDTGAELEAVPKATLRNEDGSPLFQSEGRLVWLIPDEKAAYAFEVVVLEAATYQMTFEVGEIEYGPAGFVAVEEPVHVEKGDVAPTLDDVETGGVTLVVFTSPSWCPSRSCQPMIDVVEEFANGRPDVSWVRVEVFDDVDVEDESDLVLSADVERWGLPSHPWLYVVDKVDRVIGVFEGAVSADELHELVG